MYTQNEGLPRFPLRFTSKKRFNIMYIQDLEDFSTAHFLTFPKIFLENLQMLLTNLKFRNTMYYRKEVFYMTISLRLNDEDTMLIKKYAEINKISISDLIRQTVMERIENEYDLEMFNKAMAEYKNNPVTYSLDKVESELGL